jgi:Tfp pilus assembly PilM family ATPase
MSVFDSLREASGPSVAVEIAADHVSAARLEMHGGAPVIQAHASEPLAPGALVPSLTAANVQNRHAVTGALERVLERTGRPRRVGLVIPDPVARVSLVRFEHVPARAADLDQLVRWQVRKTAPFPIDEAQVSYVPGLGAADGQEFIVSLARRSIVEEYEGLCADAGAHAGVVDLATFNVINAVLATMPASPADNDPSTRAGSTRATSSGDWLLVHVAPDYASIAILRGSNLIFFRNRATDGEGTLADVVHQATMYYEDRLQGSGFARAFLAGASGANGRQRADAEELRRSLQERLQRPIEAVDASRAATLTDRITVSPPVLETLAPLVGLLLRGREAA